MQLTSTRAVPPDPARRRYWTVLGLLLLLGAGAAAAAAAMGARAEAGQAPADIITLSIVGTNDLHGRVFPNEDRGGLALLAGYVNNLRAARAADGGAVLLFDAGDTYQGGIESNLSEGSVVIDAYNALGYAAAAIGNHDFEFGAVDQYPPRLDEEADLRGALKARAAQARFPFLAANLVDIETGRLVDWPNVYPSTMVEAAGLKVGVVGVMTLDALRLTLLANVQGLRVTPLAPAVEAEATRLRAAGADLVVVVSHAGGYCARFENPDDLSSCDDAGEMFEVARALPPGLVDVIVAGHTHAGLAHRVAGVSIIEAESLGRAFGRVDVHVDRRTRRVRDTTLFPPRDLCAAVTPGSLFCEPRAADKNRRIAATYEGRPVQADPAMDRAMAPALARVEAIRATPLGVLLETPIGRDGVLESPVANLFADAMRDSVPGADVAVSYSVGPGGLRTDLPPGPLTFGALYDVFPFDNRMVTLTLSGDALRQVFEDALTRRRRSGLAVSGLRVTVACGGEVPRISLTRASGQPVRGDDRLRVVTTDFMVQRSPFSLITPEEGINLTRSAPLAREVVAAWLARRGGRLRDSELVRAEEPRWRIEGAQVAACAPSLVITEGPRDAPPAVNLPAPVPPVPLPVSSAASATAN
ncbi:MAG: bifunctional UDP-sugar hydrolase/5'-nucleotidase [Vicinamibacterales bacterium]